MRGKSGGSSALKTIFIVLFTCIFTVTCLHLTYFDTWVQKKLHLDTKREKDNLLTTISDYSPIQTTEPVPVGFHDLPVMLQLFDVTRMITDKDGGKIYVFQPRFFQKISAFVDK